MQDIKWKVLTRTKHKIWRKEKLLQNGRTREDFMEELAYKGLLKIDCNWHLKRERLLCRGNNNISRGKKNTTKQHKIVRCGQEIVSSLISRMVEE